MRVWTIALAFVMRYAFVHRAFAIREHDTSGDVVGVLVPGERYRTNFPTCYKHTT